MGMCDCVCTYRAVDQPLLTDMSQFRLTIQISKSLACWHHPAAAPVTLWGLSDLHRDPCSHADGLTVKVTVVFIESFPFVFLWNYCLHGFVNNVCRRNSYPVQPLYRPQSSLMALTQRCSPAVRSFSTITTHRATKGNDRSAYGLSPPDMLSKDKISQVHNS